MRPELVYISALRLNDMTQELTVKRIRGRGGLKNDYKNGQCQPFKTSHQLAISM